MNQDLLDAKTTVCPGPDLVSANVEDEIVILDLDGGKYYGLEGVGARVWELIQQSESLDGIRRIILEEYNVDSDEFDRDLAELLSEMADEGLIQVNKPAV